MIDPVISHDAATIYLGNCLDVLRDMPDASVDSIATDPPYGLSNTDPAHVVEALTKWATGDRAFTPTGRGFMGKTWDAFVPPPAVWDECFRVLKPGGHLLAFAGSRTFDLMTLSIRFAGFDIRDGIAWLYGSGFPKSLDVSKAIDKLDATEERLRRAREFQSWLREHITPKRINEITDTDMGHHLTTHPTQPAVATAGIFDQLRPHLPKVPERIEELVRQRTVESENFAKRPPADYATGVGMADSWTEGKGWNGKASRGGTAITPEAASWQGWGTALKPAFEPIVVARKPLIGTVAANVLAHGTGALNIDATRVATDENLNGGAYTKVGGRSESASLHSGSGMNVPGKTVGTDYVPPAGRWPTNVVLDGDTADALDEQSGERKSAKPSATGRYGEHEDTGGNAILGRGLASATPNRPPYGDSGGASRYFPTFREGDLTSRAAPALPTFRYQAKAPTRERPTYFRPSCDCEYAWPTPTTSLPRATDETAAPASSNTSKSGSGSTVDPWSQTDVCGVCGAAPKREAHATVKPLALMRWLVKLVTPPGGVVLDPFVGSGTTVEAAALEGFNAIGIEGEADYLPLIQQRLDRLPTA